MSIEKLEEFAKDGDKNLDNLDVNQGFLQSEKPERQWFNDLFNKITKKTNEVIDYTDGVVDDLAAQKLDTGVIATAKFGGLTRGLDAVLADLINPTNYGAQWLPDFDNTAALQEYIDRGFTELVIGDCTLSSIQLLDGNSYKIALAGDLKHKAGAIDSMFKSGSGTKISIVGFDHSIDGNQINQSSPVSLFSTTGAEVAKFTGVKFKNIKKYGVENRNSAIRHIRFESCDFTDAALHTGVLGGSTGFINLFGGRLNEFIGCFFKQTADPVGTQNRNPSGIFISGSGEGRTVSVRNCEFDNLGHNVAGNLESPLDIYAYCETVEYVNNKFKRSRFNAFRATNVGTALIENNTVTQDVPIINDGGGDYLDSACFSGGIVGRGYAVNDRDNDIITLRNNKFHVQNVRCQAAVIANDSTTKKMKRAVFDNNEFLSTGTNGASQAVLLNKVRSSTFKDNDMLGFATTISVQNTNIDALVGDLAQLNITGGKLGGTGVALFARLALGNLSININNVDMSKNTGSLLYTVRSTKKLTIANSDFPISSNGEASNNAAFYFYNNVLQLNAQPTGLTTNTFYRSYNNTAIADSSSTITP